MSQFEEKHNVERLVTIWTQMFGSAPEHHTVERFATYANTDIKQRLVILFLTNSASYKFRNEQERAAWISGQLIDLRPAGDVDPETRAIREAVGQMVNHWLNGPGDMRSTNAMLDTLERIQEDPLNFFDTFLSYLHEADPTRAKAEAFLQEHGAAAATYGDMKSFLERKADGEVAEAA